VPKNRNQQTDDTDDHGEYRETDCGLLLLNHVFVLRNHFFAALLVVRVGTKVLQLPEQHTRSGHDQPS
jgi:hypothetical protein